MPEKPLVLIDASSYLFRAYHALPPLTSPQGQPTGAVFGVINMLKKLLNDYQPEYVAAVFDAKGKTFRHKLAPFYKANRPTMPEELAAQIQPLHNIIKAMGIPLIVVEGVEADDIIGTLAKQAEAHQMKTVISTGDKDIAQLVDDHISLINTMTNTTLDAVGVKEKFGIWPTQMIDYLTLVGDTSDNIPGVPKVGPKTAVKWLNEFESLDNILANADKIPGKIGENLRNTQDQLPLSKELVTIQCELDLGVRLLDLKQKAPDQEKLHEYFTTLGFKKWLTESNTQNPAPDNNYQLITQKKTLDQWVQKLKDAPYFALDTETTNLDPMLASLVGISISITPGEAMYIPIEHDYPEAPEQLSQSTVFEALTPILTDKQKIIVGQNLKYDLCILANHGIEITAQLFDTMLASYILDNASNRHNLDTLALKHLDHTMISFEDVAGKGKNQRTFNQVPLGDALDYAAEDADITLRLYEIFQPLLAADPTAKKLFDDIEMPLMPVLLKMERHGVLIDSDQLHQQSDVLSKRIAELEEQAHLLAGEAFNLSSPKQLQTIFFEKLNLPMIEKTPKGQPSTSESVLQALAVNYKLPQCILEHRSLSKLRSTYTDKLPERVNPKTGRLHCSYNQAVTATGRLSSTHPNLQNIPIRTPAGRQVRQAFIAPDGYQIVSADYSQIELRIMAHLSQDAGLLKAFADGLDIHQATAAEVFEVALSEVTALQRRHAKAVNFGLIYGMSAFGLAKQLGIERKQAQDYIDRYFERYPGIKTYMETTRAQAHEQGYVETLLGRRLPLPNINSKNPHLRNAAERAAINAPMQGTAADIIKIAMIRIQKWLEQSSIDAHMTMQVHDELVFEVATKDQPTLISTITEHMSQATQLAVPLIVSVGTGRNWDDAH